MAKPDLIGVYQSSTWDRVPGNASRTTSAFDVVDGDLLIVLSGIETNDGGQAISLTNNGGAITWTTLDTAQAGTPSTSTFIRAFSTVITGGARIGLTVTATMAVSTGNAIGVIVYHYRNHGGVGAVVKRIGVTTVASAVDLLMSSVTANAAIAWLMGDWSGAANASPTYRTADAGAITQRVNFTNALAWTAISADHADAGAAGAKHVGFTQSADWTMIAVEVLGLPDAAATLPLPLLFLLNPVSIGGFVLPQPVPFYAPVAASTNVPVGLLTETDLVQPFSVTKRRTLGQVAETDTPQPITRQKRVTLGLLTEADTVQPIVARHSRTLGQLAETDTVQPFSHTKLKTLGAVQETDTVFPIVRAGTVKFINLGLLTETDLIQPLVKRKTKPVGQLSEVDAVFALSRRHQRTLSFVVETDLLQTTTVVKGTKRLTLGVLADAETIPAIQAIKVPVAPAISSRPRYYIHGNGPGLRRTTGR